MLYKANYKKRLRDKCSRAGKRSQQVQALKREAMAQQYDSFEDIIDRAKRDRKGKKYATFERDKFKVTLYHSLNRSDQFDIVTIKPSKFDGAQDIEKRINNLSMPKVMRIFNDGI